MEGYSSPPPPGAFGGGRQSAPAAPSAGRYTLASWWSRVGAALIDGLIIVVGAVVILALFGALFSVGFLAGDTAGIDLVIVGLILSVIAIAIVALLYAPVMMARTNGQTLGRMALGIRVIARQRRADDVRLRDAARGRRQGAALRHRRARSPSASPTSPTSCGRCGTRRTARCTTSSSTRASCATDRRSDGGGARGTAALARPAPSRSTWSRPGPTLMSAIGTPTKSEM